MSFFCIRVSQSQWPRRVVFIDCSNTTKIHQRECSRNFQGYPDVNK